MRVDLPAPLPPARAWTSPFRTSKLTSLRTDTPLNPLEIERISTTLSGVFIVALSARCGGMGPPHRRVWLLLVGVLDVLRSILVIDLLPGLQDVGVIDRQGAQCHVCRCLLADECSCVQPCLGYSLVER